MFVAIAAFLSLISVLVVTNADASGRLSRIRVSSGQKGADTRPSTHAHSSPQLAANAMDESHSSLREAAAETATKKAASSSWLGYSLGSAAAQQHAEAASQSQKEGKPTEKRRTGGWGFFASNRQTTASKSQAKPEKQGAKQQAGRNETRQKDGDSREEGTAQASARASVGQTTDGNVGEKGRLAGHCAGAGATCANGVLPSRGPREESVQEDGGIHVKDERIGSSGERESARRSLAGAVEAKDRGSEDKEELSLHEQSARTKPSVQAEDLGVVLDIINMAGMVVLRIRSYVNVSRESKN
jgi:hypothetical protein